LVVADAIDEHSGRKAGSVGSFVGLDVAVSVHDELHQRAGRVGACSRMFTCLFAAAPAF